MSIQLYKQANGSWASQPDGTDATGRPLVPGQDKVQYKGNGIYSTDAAIPEVSTAGADFHPLTELGNARKEVTNALGITNPDAPDLSKGPDATNLRDFASTLRREYETRTPGVAKTVGVTPIGAATLDQTQANEARATQQRNLAGLEATANGGPTAADALLTRGTDAARNTATGLAAALSRSNPGLALRTGIQGGNQAVAQSNAIAAEQKAREIAAARGQLGQFSDAVRGQDLNAAKVNADAENDVRKTNLVTDLNAQTTNATNDLSQKNLNNRYEIDKGNQVDNAYLAPYNADVANQKIQLENQKNNQEGLGALYTGLGKAFSDERVKEDVKPVSLADALARSVPGVTYKYKEGVEDGGKHAGILAGDLEKVLPGVVKRTKGGLRVVNTDHLALAHTGVISELAKRLKAVEDKRA